MSLRTATCSSTKSNTAPFSIPLVTGFSSGTPTLLNVGVSWPERGAVAPDLTSVPSSLMGINKKEWLGLLLVAGKARDYWKKRTLNQRMKTDGWLLDGWYREKTTWWFTSGTVVVPTSEEMNREEREQRGEIAQNAGQTIQKFWIDKKCF